MTLNFFSEITKQPVKLKFWPYLKRDLRDPLEDFLKSLDPTSGNTQIYPQGKGGVNKDLINQWKREDRG